MKNINRGKDAQDTEDSKHDEEQTANIHQPTNREYTATAISLGVSQSIRFMQSIVWLRSRG